MFRPNTLALTALLAALTAIGPLSTDVYLPSLPDIGRAFGASATWVQLTLSAFLIGFAAGQIVYGPISDRHGRRSVLLAAIIIFCCGSLICTLAPSIEILIAARCLQSFGAAGAIVLARAVVRDLYSGARAGKELSVMGAIMALAPIAGPVIGGVLHTAFGWRSAFAALLLAGLMLGAMAWLKLPETLKYPAPDPVTPRAMLKVYRSLLDRRDFLLYAGIAAACYSGLFAWLSSASFILQDIYGLTPLVFAFYFLPSAVGFLIGTSIASRIVSRIGIERTIGIGAAVLVAGGLAMMLSLTFAQTSAFSVVFPAALYIIGLGLTWPQALAGGLTPFPDRAGAASSLLGVIPQSFAAVAGVTVVALLDKTAWPLAIALTLTGALTLLFWLMSRRLPTHIA
ncbi:MAG: multidrug effflux MFS transporter [Pseudorhodoplanes sp.]|jgi:DHA1 family bicyclomycin/chloramphenicol resistance-like MFS transporter|nr:multidrug effflux MFS transporter [Pseudorhodoplanes sp.]